VGLDNTKSTTKVSHIQELSLSVKSQPHKQHIWFLPTHESTLKKPKEQFFTNALKRK
jgi:hypothetical protein